MGTSATGEGFGCGASSAASKSRGERRQARGWRQDDVAALFDGSLILSVGCFYPAPRCNEHIDPPGRVNTRLPQIVVMAGPRLPGGTPPGTSRRSQRLSSSGARECPGGSRA